MTLTPKKPFAVKKTVQLRVNGQPPSGLHDTAGDLIDGDHDGQPDGNAVALLRRNGATISVVVPFICPGFRSSTTYAVIVPQ